MGITLSKEGTKNAADGSDKCRGKSLLHQPAPVDRPVAVLARLSLSRHAIAAVRRRW